MMGDMFIGLDEWDSPDIFLPEKHFWTMVTYRVRPFFLKINLQIYNLKISPKLT